MTGFSHRLVEVVVKVGGGVLRHAVHFERVLTEIAAASHGRRLLIVPGGGPFADTVREVDRVSRLPDDSAHWMAVLGMDQYAFLLTARLEAAVLVEDLRGIDRAIRAEKVPVLAPFKWLRTIDPLPHTWHVTSDSIAAWVSAEVRAERLVLVKPPGAVGADLVDSYFEHALPAHVRAIILPADRITALGSAIHG
jgi:aspartokinase-like uncharacterized kinase